MAITISTQPDTALMYSAYRPITYIVTSNAATISKVQCEVYINGTLVKTIVHDPDINTSNQFTFDVSGFVRDNLSYFTLTNIASLHAVSESATNTRYIQCVFNEVLLTSGVLVVQSTDYTSNTSYACNATLQHQDTQNLSAYFVDSTAKLFMTNTPDNARIHRNETIRLSFITGLTTIKSRLYQYQGTTLLGTSSSSNSIGANVKRGTVTINTTYLSGLCDNFKIELTNSSDVAVSAQRSYRVIDEACEDYKQIWFINKFGDYDQFTFTGEFVEGLNVTSSEYKKIIATTFSVRDRGLQTFRVNAFEKFQTTSRPLNRTEYRWLKELKVSPDLYLKEVGDSFTENFVPIVPLNRDKYLIEGNNIGEPMTLEYVKANDIIVQ